MSKLKILDLKSFAGKCMEYKSWKTDMMNKIKIDHEKFNNNYERKAYIFNYLKNDDRNQTKATVLAYLKIHQSYSFQQLWIFLDNQYMDTEIKIKIFNKL